MKNVTFKTRHALVLSCISLMTCFAMLLGTTFAWFTDSVTSGVNKIIAGNLDVEATYYDGNNYSKSIKDAEDIFVTPSGQDKGLWEPGHVEVAYLKITNAGTLALNYKVALDPSNETGGTNINGDSFKLSDYLNAAVISSDTAPAPYATRDAAVAAADGAASTGKLTAVMMTNIASQTAVKLLPGAEKYITLIVYMPTTVDNVANHKTGTPAPTISFALSVFASQVEHEYDSYGNDYDGNPDWPTVSSITINETAGATAAAAVDTSGTVTLSTTKDTTISGNAATSTIPQNTSFELDKKLDTTGAPTTEPYVAPGDGKTDSVTDLSRVIKTTNSSEGTLALDISYKATVTTTTNTATSATTTTDYAVKSFSDIVTNEVFIGTGLTNVAVTHNSAAMKKLTAKPTGTLTDQSYYYDATTGMLYIYSKTYSPYAVTWDVPTYVARIGSVGYTTLPAAIAAAQDGETVVLLKDVTLGKISNTDNVSVPITKDLTLDGGGHTLYSKAGRGIWVDESDVTFNLKNLTIKAAEGNEAFERAVQVNSGKTNVTLTIDNCEMKSTYYAINFCNETSVDVTINNSTVTGWGALNIWSNGVTINAKNSTFNGVNNKGYNADGWNDFSTICLEADTTGQTALGSSNMQLSFTNCTITASQTTGNKQQLIGFNNNNSDGAKSNSVLLTNCTLTYSGEDYDPYYDYGTNNVLKAVNSTLNGKTFNYDSTTTAEVEPEPVQT